MKAKLIVKIAAAALLSFVAVSCMDFVDDDIKNSVSGTPQTPPKDVTITFNLDGGSGVTVLDGKVGEALTAPDNPVKEGYEFAGWNPALPEEFPDEDTTYTATWRLEGDWAIIYNLNGGTNVTENPSGYNIETPTITLAAPTKSGCAFSGWYTTETFDEGSEITEIPQGSIGDIALYAKWDIIPYSIFYNLNDGTNAAENPITYTVETPTITLAAPSKIGYIGSWYTTETFDAGTEKTEIATGSTGDITLWANWQAVEYNITYSLDGGTNDENNPASYTIETPTITLAIPHKAGCVFSGWYTTETFDEGSEKTQIEQGTTGDIALYANWDICLHTIAMRNSSGNFTCACGEKEFLKTSEASVITAATTVLMTDDSAWNGYGTNATYDKGMFMKNREVTLSPYVMGKYEVTQELFEAVMGVNPSICVQSNNSYKNMLEGETQEFRPVDGVNWYSAIAFCNKLSILCGLEPCYELSEISDWANLAYADIPTANNATWNKVVCDLKKNGYRLPTEAEWEFAARGGDTETPEWKYSYSGVNTEKAASTFSTAPFNDTKLDDYGWYKFNLTGSASTTSAMTSGTAGYGTHEVGVKEPNSLGLYDMSGNVSEWCWDWFSATVSTAAVTDPAGPASGSTRTQRGGNWNVNAFMCSVSRRTQGQQPGSKTAQVGFRIARSL